MSVLQNVLFSHRCTSTHHKLVLDALRHLRRDDAEALRRMFLKHGESLLAGATAPDDKFARISESRRPRAREVLGRCRRSGGDLVPEHRRSAARQDWTKAAYSAGVLSHYYTDPLMPLHTAETEEAGIVHRACERKRVSLVRPPHRHPRT